MLQTEKLWLCALLCASLRSVGISSWELQSLLHLALLPGGEAQLLFLPLFPLISPNESRERLHQQDLPVDLQSGAIPDTHQAVSSPPPPSSHLPHHSPKGKKSRSCSLKYIMQ